MSNFIKLNEINYTSLNKYSPGTILHIVTDNIKQVIGTEIILSKEKVKHYNIIKAVYNVKNKINIYNYIYYNGVSWFKKVNFDLTANAQNNTIIGAIFMLYFNIVETEIGFISKYITGQQIRENDKKIYVPEIDIPEYKTANYYYSNNNYYCKMKQELHIEYKNNNIAIIKIICSINPFKTEETQSRIKYKYIQFSKNLFSN